MAIASACSIVRGEGHPLLPSPLDVVLERWVGVGGRLSELGRLPMDALRAPGLVLGAFAVLAWRGHGLGATSRPGALVAIALALAWIGQSFWLDGATAVGSAAIALACVAYGSALGAAGARAPAPTDSGAGEGAAGGPSPRELLTALALLALFVLLGLWRLGLHPDVYFDEVAYTKAARMWLGTLDPGPILGVWGWEGYPYELFRSQALALSFHAAALALLPPGVAALRLAALLAIAAALAATWWTLRMRIGAGAALLMLGLAAGAPLLLAFGRNGQYIAFSTLHGALCFLALLGWLEGPRGLRGIVLGLLLGASLYLYQLSWFAPVLAALGALAASERWRRAPWRRAGPVAIVAALLVLPSLSGLVPGLSAVGAQTFGKAPWSRSGEPAPGRRDAIVFRGREREPELARALASRLAGEGLRVGALEAGLAAVQVSGPPSRVADALEIAASLGWKGPPDYARPRSEDSLSRMRRMAAALFYAPAWESAGRFVAVPLLDPLLAPLILLGMVGALHRRSQLCWRLLLVWCAGALLLPAALGGALPRRVMLAVPFVHALAALPLVDLYRLAPAVARRAVALLLALLVAASLALGPWLYFERWGLRFGNTAPLGVLDFLASISDIPEEELVASPLWFSTLTPKVVAESVDLRPRRLRQFRELDGQVLRRLACREALPVHALLERERGAAVVRALAGDFSLAAGPLGERLELRRLRIADPRPGACAKRER